MIEKTPTTISMLCRAENWSLFKKEPMSGNARCGHSRMPKLENWCHNWLHFVLVSDKGMQPFSYHWDHNACAIPSFWMRYVLLSLSAVRLLAAFDMHQYTTAEMTDMVLAYGKADCSGRAAARLYAERFPNRQTPHHSSFAAIERRLIEAGEFHICT